MEVRSECRLGRFDLICEHCNKKVVSDIIVSDNGQPFLQVRCGTCDNTEEFELDPDCWPELPSKLK
jgi:transcription elongation factor Elf1